MLCAQSPRPQKQQRRPSFHRQANLKGSSPPPWPPLAPHGQWWRRHGAFVSACDAVTSLCCDPGLKTVNLAACNALVDGGILRALSGPLQQLPSVCTPGTMPLASPRDCVTAVDSSLRVVRALLAVGPNDAPTMHPPTDGQLETSHSSDSTCIDLARLAHLGEYTAKLAAAASEVWGGTVDQLGVHGGHSQSTVEGVSGEQVLGGSSCLSTADLGSTVPCPSPGSPAQLLGGACCSLLDSIVQERISRHKVGGRYIPFWGAGSVRAMLPTLESGMLLCVPSAVQLVCWSVGLVAPNQWCSVASVPGEAVPTLVAALREHARHSDVFFDCCQALLYFPTELLVMHGGVDAFFREGSC